MNHKSLTPGDEKSHPAPLFERGLLKSPFGKGGFRGILVFAVKPSVPLAWPTYNYFSPTGAF
jgi:hypothetical protein